MASRLLSPPLPRPARNPPHHCASAMVRSSRVSSSSGNHKASPMSSSASWFRLAFKSSSSDMVIPVPGFSTSLSISSRPINVSRLASGRRHNKPQATPWHSASSAASRLPWAIASVCSKSGNRAALMMVILNIAGLMERCYQLGRLLQSRNIKAQSFSHC